jgi:hypothetical protein
VIPLAPETAGATNAELVHFPNLPSPFQVQASACSPRWPRINLRWRLSERLGLRAGFISTTGFWRLWRATLLNLTAESLLPLASERGLRVRSSIQVSQQRAVVLNDSLEPGLCVCLAHQVAGILRNVLEDADHGIVLLVIMKQGHVRVLSQRDELAKSPLQSLVDVFNRNTYGVGRGLEGIQFDFDVVQAVIRSIEAVIHSV